MNSERPRGSEAKPRFDTASPPLSELAQRARDASGKLGLTVGYEPLTQTFNGVPICDLVEWGEWPPAKDTD